MKNQSTPPISTHNVVIFLLGFPFFSGVSAGAEKLEKEQTHFRLSLTQMGTESVEVGNDNIELQRDSFLLNAGGRISLDRQWSSEVSLGYDRQHYDWRNVRSTRVDNVSQQLFGADGQVWNKINRYRAGVSLNYRFDKHWGFFLAPQLQYAYADTDATSFSHAQSYGVVASAMYTFDSGNMIGFGVAYLNDIDDVRTVPYLAMRWQIDDNWMLANPFRAGFSGTAGLELSYKFNSDWNIGFGSSKRIERFLIQNDGTAVEINEWVSYLRGGWQTTPTITVNFYVGYYFNGELEVTHKAAIDMGNQGVGALDIEFKF